VTSPAEQERTALEKLVVALSYAQGIEAVTEALRAFPGVAMNGIRLLLSIPQVRALARLNPHPGAHAAVLAMQRHNLMRRAGYLVAAGRRMSTAAQRAGQSTQVRDSAVYAERRWLAQHLRAQAGRESAANQVAAKAKAEARRAKRDGTAWNGLLGWYAVMDDRTSRECREANGRNFKPTKVPAIGFPGAVHPSCRCKPGPPHATDRRVEDVQPDPYDPNKASQPRRVTIGA
jgi:hypothetical protein